MGDPWGLRVILHDWEMFRPQGTARGAWSGCTPWTLPNVTACPCSLGAGDGLGVPVLPPPRQIYSDSFVTWAAAEPGRLCGALGCSGLLWGAEPCAACGGVGMCPRSIPQHLLPKTPVEYSLTFDFLLMARVTLVPLIQ